MANVFIDLSYLIFHRYHAIMRWYKFVGKEEWTQAEVFERFEKTFENNLISFKKNHEFEWHNLVFAKDTHGVPIWRTTLFPAYKANRKESTNTIDPDIFPHVINTFLPQLAQKFGFHIIGYASAEADDIVGIAHRILRKDSDCHPILILTNDHDYLQLHDQFTLIVNANGQDISKKYSQDILDVFLEYKICRGDISDNIPSIGKKIGDKTALKLAKDPTLLQKLIEANQSVATQYELNKTLISFQRIPDDIVNRITNILSECLND